MRPDHPRRERSCRSSSASACRSASTFPTFHGSRHRRLRFSAQNNQTSGPRKPSDRSRQSRRPVRVRYVFAGHHLDDGYTCKLTRESSETVYQLADDGTRRIISHTWAKFTKAKKGYERERARVARGTPEIQIPAEGRPFHLANGP